MRRAVRAESMPSGRMRHLLSGRQGSKVPSLYHAAVRCQSVKNLQFLEDAPITAGRANPGARWWSRGTPPNAVGARGKLILCVARHGVRSHAVPVGLVGAPSRGVRKCPASPLSSYRVIAPLGARPQCSPEYPLSRAWPWRCRPFHPHRSPTPWANASQCARLSRLAPQREQRLLSGQSHRRRRITSTGAPSPQDVTFATR